MLVSAVQVVNTKHRSARATVFPAFQVSTQTNRVQLPAKNVQSTRTAMSRLLYLVNSASQGKPQLLAQQRVATAAAAAALVKLASSGIPLDTALNVILGK